MNVNDTITIYRTNAGGDVQEKQVKVTKITPSGRIYTMDVNHSNNVIKFDKKGREIDGSRFTYWIIKR